MNGAAYAQVLAAKAHVRETIDKRITLEAITAKRLRREALRLPYDVPEAEALRELAGIHEFQAAIWTNYRNKWFGDGASPQGSEAP